MDDLNFERRSGSDVSQICASVANPLVSPQPVVGIHFEARTVEGLIIIPPPLDFSFFFFFQIPPVSRISNRNTLPPARTQANTRRSGTNVNEIWPSLRSRGFRC